MQNDQPRTREGGRGRSARNDYYCIAVASRAARSRVRSPPSPLLQRYQTRPCLTSRIARTAHGVGRWPLCTATSSGPREAARQMTCSRRYREPSAFIDKHDQAAQQFADAMESSIGALPTSPTSFPSTSRKPSGAVCRSCSTSSDEPAALLECYRRRSFKQAAEKVQKPYHLYLDEFQNFGRSIIRPSCANVGSSAFSLRSPDQFISQLEPQRASGVQTPPSSHGAGFFKSKSPAGDGRGLRGHQQLQSGVAVDARPSRAFAS
jgi:hypothetical protein